MNAYSHVYGEWMNTFIVVKREYTVLIYVMNITIAMGGSDLVSPMYTNWANMHTWHAYAVYYYMIVINEAMEAMYTYSSKNDIL